MKKTLLSMLTVAPLLFAQAQTFTYTYSGLPIPVYPDDWDTVSVATIFVPRAIAITKVTAAVQVQFSGVGDLNVYMFSAAGTRIRLLERNCSGLQNIDTTFDDAGPSRFADTCPTEAGRGPFRGNEPLANANGQISSAIGVSLWRIMAAVKRESEWFLDHDYGHIDRAASYRSEHHRQYLELSKRNCRTR